MLHKTLLALTAAATIGAATLPATQASAWGWHHSHYSWHFGWHRHFAWHRNYGWHRHYGWYHHWHGRRA